MAWLGELIAQGVGRQVADIAIGLKLTPGPALTFLEDAHSFTEQGLAGRYGIAARFSMDGDDRLGRPDMAGPR